ncbi:MAG: hypothetical protein FK734_09235 [Asgard group archaeon]|nr:hypothetical protein [Asgard group archaeon]
MRFKKIMKMDGIESIFVSVLVLIFLIFRTLQLNAFPPVEEILAYGVLIMFNGFVAIYVAVVKGRKK